MTREEIQAQIEVLKAELNNLEELANKPEAPKKFEFEFPVGKTYVVNTLEGVVSHSCRGDDPIIINTGLYRTKEKGAEMSLARNIRANRLEMLAEYLGGLKKFEYDEGNWYVFYECGTKTWRHEVTYTNYGPEKVYMTLEVAKKIARLLNSEEYEL